VRHPDWIKVKLTGTHETKKILRHHGVSTVCEEARCPNQGKCFSKKTATFMILGNRCTRNCSFCAVESSLPLPLDHDEPQKVAAAVVSLGLEFVVITSVSRDDLPDGGAKQFSLTIQAVRRIKNSIKIEVLTPDFQGNKDSLREVLNARPDVFNHNVETVPRLYPGVRPQADYHISVDILKQAKEYRPDIKTKSGIMVGLGENEGEVISVMKDLHNVGCDYLTIGQYLRPRRINIPVIEYIHPDIFEKYRVEALNMGFASVSSSPLTRSSMDAQKMLEKNL
jgi:lipoic acid synthetase